MENLLVAVSFNIPVLVLVLAIIIIIIIILLQSLKSRKHGVGNDVKLPPGSMGWPCIGETLQLYSQDPNVFLSTRHKRYGEIFKSHILGCPCVLLASPEAARFVLISQAHLFKPSYPKSKENLIGPWALFFHQDEYHMRLRRLVQGSLYPESIRKLVFDIEELTLSSLKSWTAVSGRVINTYNEMKKLSFEVGILAIFGNLEPRLKQELKENYINVERGYNSFPTNLPGSRYRRAMKARRRLSEILNEIIARERKASKNSNDHNLICSLLSYRDDEKLGRQTTLLSEEQIADNIIGVLFAAQDTTASALTWTLKYLHDSPKLLEAVKVEHQRIVYESNGNGSGRLTWSQTRNNMPLTHKVILESLRMSSIISFTFREATTDIEYKGYHIPKGWKVMPLFRSIHHNPDFFKEPQIFDPNRFVSAIKPNTLMPFGSGSHACPGNELAKLEILIMLLNLSIQNLGFNEKSFIVDLKKGEVKEGTCEEGKPDATFSFTDDDFVKVATGKLNPQMAFMRGAMKIKGSISAAQKFTPDIFPKPSKM